MHESAEWVYYVLKHAVTEELQVIPLAIIDKMVTFGYAKYIKGVTSS